MKKCLMGLLVFALMIGSAGAASVLLNPSTQTIDNSVVTTVELVINNLDADGAEFEQVNGGAGTVCRA
jgi:uncharacterized GH25 family protein